METMISTSESSFRKKKEKIDVEKIIEIKMYPLLPTYFESVTHILLL